MKEGSSDIVTRLLDNRKLLLELIIAAVLLSLSIHLIAGSILDLNWISPLCAFVLASILAVMCTAYFVVRLLWFRTHTYTFKGFIIIHSKKNEVVDIPQYDYGHDLHDYLQAAFAENAAIKRLWDKEPIDKGLHHDKKKGELSCTVGKGHQLIIEATEYYILENLSTHLADYFNRPAFDEQNLHTFARNDIPDVLLSNRFLELFSKPMEDRALFSTKAGAASHTDEFIIVQTGKDGAVYIGRVKLLWLWTAREVLSIAASSSYYRKTHAYGEVNQMP
jgi:hypothetical protein